MSVRVFSSIDSRALQFCGIQSPRSTPLRYHPRGLAFSNRRTRPISVVMAPPAAIQTQPTTILPAKKDTPDIPRGDVTATLNFFAPPADGSVAYNDVGQQQGGRLQSNYGDVFEDVEIRDIRSTESDFNLDKDAFEVVSGVSSAMSEEDWLDDETIERVYYPEVTKVLLDNVPGSHKVTVFDHTIRRTSKSAPRGPVQKVHVDQTARSTEWRVKLHDPDESDALLKDRYRIINVWRSIDGPVQSFPLAFASAATVDSDDLRPVELRYPDRTGETAGVVYNPAQKFFYWSGMDDDERIFLKCYDSRDGVGKSVPHTSFVHQRTPEDARGRASIEVRALVYG